MAVEKVEGHIEVLMSILVRLPPKSMFRFRCVSNRWNNIITKPYFLKSYSAITRKHLPRGERLLAFIQLTRSRNLESQLLLPSELGNFINSSNGLILCHSESFDTYHVGNPLTKKWVLLPPPEITYRTHHGISTGLVCEENTNELVPNYTVVRGGIARIRDGQWDIETYSSRTATWAAVSTLISTGNFSLHSEEPPLGCNGVVHWLGWESIALYDLNGGENENENHLQLIMLTVVDDGTYYDSSLTRSERDNVLWFGIADAYIYQMMRFWMLPYKNEDGSYRRSTTITANEWVLMHTISSASLQKEPAMKLLENNNEVLESNFMFSLEGLIPCNPVIVVLRLGERVFLHNLETKSIEPLLRYDTKCGIPTWKHFVYLHMLFEQIDSFHNRSKRIHIARKGRP